MSAFFYLYKHQMYAGEAQLQSIYAFQLFGLNKKKKKKTSRPTDQFFPPDMLQ